MTMKGISVLHCRLALPHPHSLFGNAPTYKGEEQEGSFFLVRFASHSVNELVNIYNLSHRMGLCTVTSFVPSGKVPST